MSPITVATPTKTLNSQQLPQSVHLLWEHFAFVGQRAFLVGGTVRDALLGRESGDLDVAVLGDTRLVGSDLALRFGGRVVVLDEERDVVRIAGSFGDPHGVIDITVIKGGIEQNLSFRDFTLDAMAVELDGPMGGELAVIDPFGGVADLGVDLVRATNHSVFDDDPGRLMRAPRLAAQLGFSIAEATADTIREKAYLLATVSAERVRDEFLKILSTRAATSAIRNLDRLGLLSSVIPELDAARGVSQPDGHHWDVFGHSVETVGQVERIFQHGPESVEPDIGMVPRFEGMDGYFAEEVGDRFTRMEILKLTGLLHDIAKPETRTVEPSGRIRFLGHNSVGAEMVGRIAKRLRLSRRTVDHMTTMVEHHLRPSQMASTDRMPSRRAVYRYYRDLGSVAFDTLYLNLADYLGARGPDLDSTEWQKHCGVISHILTGATESEKLCGRPKLIDGTSLIKVFGLEPGPLLGELLEIVREAQAEGDISSPEEALELVSSCLSRGGGVA